MLTPEFNETRFHAKMIMKYENLYYDLVGIDFETGKLGLRLRNVINNDDVEWINYNNVTIYKQ